MVRKADVQSPKDAISKIEEGDEEVRILDKTYKSHWVETTMKHDDGSSTQKAWLVSDEVPGGLVRAVLTQRQGGKVVSRSTTELTHMKAP